MTKENENLKNENEIKQQEVNRKQNEIDKLEGNISSISYQHSNIHRKYQQLELENEKLLNDLSKLEKQFEWALSELKLIDEHNEKIARRIALTHGIQVRYVRTTWENMPQ